MFVRAGRVYWSASDLTRAAECEFGLLRELDVKLGRCDSPNAVCDPLADRISEMGDQHEQRILAGLEADATVSVVTIQRVGTASMDALEQLHQGTMSTLESAPDVVYQAGFFDGEFHGYADFLIRSAAGWIVADTKLARRARPKALLQLAAYADQLHTAGLPVAPQAALMLGSGQTEVFPLKDIAPVFRERRARLRSLMHRPPRRRGRRGLGRRRNHPLRGLPSLPVGGSGGQRPHSGCWAPSGSTPSAPRRRCSIGRRFGCIDSDAGRDDVRIIF